MRLLAKQIVLALALVLGTTVVQGTTATAQAQVVRIGVDIAAFPRMVAVPGYPVYYAPDVRANYFFYDGLFWVFNVDDGYWYSSSWYNGPWVVVEPDFVPQPILVVPYRYYHVRPAYWGGWAYDRPPRWDIYWGPRWVEHHHNWNHWDRNRRWTAAPLPVFQRDYPRNRYPAPAQQVTIYKQRYNYKPRDVVVRERQTTIIERQSRGGERASGRAEWLQLKNEDRAQRQANVQQNRQTRENIREQEKAQRQSNAQQNRQQREAIQQQDRAQRQTNNQRREDLRQDRAQRQAADQANRQRQEDLRQQDKARRESNNQAERAQRQAAAQHERAQRQANVQQDRQRQEDARQQSRQQDRAQRQANVQAERSQRQVAAQQERAQRQAGAQQERAQRQANGHQDRSQHQANVQERGRDAKEKGDQRG